MNNPFTKCTSRPSAIDNGDIKYISALIEANLLLYLDEIQRQLEATQHKSLSISTLACLLVQHGLTKKKVQKSAAERDKELRTIWEADMAQYTDPDVFVALDESAIDNQTVQCEYGHSVVGTLCV